MPRIRLAFFSKVFKVPGCDGTGSQFIVLSVSPEGLRAQFMYPGYVVEGCDLPTLTPGYLLRLIVDVLEIVTQVSSLSKLARERAPGRFADLAGSSLTFYFYFYFPAT